MTRFPRAILLLSIMLLCACNESTDTDSKSGRTTDDTKGSWYKGLPDDERAKGVTPLMWASSFGDIAKVRTLLIQGADVTARDNDGWTALHYSTLGGDGPLSEGLGSSHSEVMKALLASGADVNAKTSNGSVALPMSAAKGQAEWVKILLQNGADVNVVDAMKRTAIINACNAGFSDDHAEATVEVLLTAAPDLTPKDGFGMTALDWAKENKRHRIVRLLRNAGAKR